MLITFLFLFFSPHLSLYLYQPQNLLLTSSLPGGDVKLCDFGISRRISEGVELREIMGTPDYVAPEILHYEAIKLETDIWSIGVLAYVLLTGFSPFRGDNNQETYSNITNGKIEFGNLFDNISNQAVDFIQKLLVRDVKIRPTANECLEHPWLCETDAVEEKPSIPVTVPISEQFTTNSTTTNNNNPKSPSPLPANQQENNKENEAYKGENSLKTLNYSNSDKSCEKTKDFFIIKMSPNENGSLPSSPSCKRFIISPSQCLIKR